MKVPILVTRLVPLILVLLSLSGFHALSRGNEAPWARLRDVQMAPDGSVRIVAMAGGDASEWDLRASNFQVTEGKKRISGIQVKRFSDAGAAQSVMIVIDASRGAEGAPLEQAKLGALSLVRNLPRTMTVGVIAISTRPRLLVFKSPSRPEIEGAIASITAGGNRALNDSVLMAGLLLKGLPGVQGNMVVFTTGKDDSSDASLSAAVAPARESGARIVAFGLRGAGSDSAVLGYLARQTAGRTVTANVVSDLAAVFAGAAHEISSQYLLTYVAPEKGPSKISVAVIIKVGENSMRDTILVDNPRNEAAMRSAGNTNKTVESAGREGAEDPAGAPGVVPGASKAPLTMGLLLAFASFALLLLTVIRFAGSEPTALESALRPYTDRGSIDISKVRSPITAQSLTHRALEFVKHLPKPRG